MPSWWGEKTPMVNVVKEPELPETPMQIVEEQAQPLAQTAQREELPQGFEAAELAAASRPRKPATEQMSHLPAPLVSASPFSPLEYNAANGIPLLPEPQPLGAPLVSAGVILPEQTSNTPAKTEDSIWNMLDLKSLPIPGLGSAQVANAAALDMPVPPAPRQASPFTPAEQLAPAASKGAMSAGATTSSANASQGQESLEAPLQPRQGPYPDSYANQPVSSGRPLSAPAPVISGRQPMNNAQVQAQELARQQQDLLVLRQQMDQRLKDLQSAEDKMKDMLEQAKGAEEKKVKSLVQMYANMKPRMAAQALENMDERVAVRILAGMAPKQSGEILTYTNPSKTAKFTEMLTRMRMSE